MASLPPAEQQLVAIAKALSHDARLLILDEPTAALTSDEAENLFSLLGELREKGSPSCTSRTGCARSSGSPTPSRSSRTAGSCARWRRPASPRTRSCRSWSDARSIACSRPSSRPVTRSCSRREISRCRVSFEASLSPSGPARSSASPASRARGSRRSRGCWPEARRRARGRVEVRGKRLKGRGVVEALRNGVGYVPPDRRSQAIIRTFSIRASTTLAGLRRVSRLGFVRSRKARNAAPDDHAAARHQDALDRGADLDALGRQPAEGRSGPRSRRGSDVLVCDEPTAGVDVGARAEIYASSRKSRHRAAPSCSSRLTCSS